MNKLGIATLLLISFTCYSSWQDTAILNWDNDLRKLTAYETGYFGAGCRRIYVDEADCIVENLRYDLRRALGKAIATKENNLR